MCNDFSRRHHRNANRTGEEKTTMEKTTEFREGQLVHIVTLECKDNAMASRCIEALGRYGKPDALAFHCASYEFGLKEGTSNVVQIVERWNRWEDLDSLLTEKVVPALPMYNDLLRRPFDPSRDTMRIELTG
jgi:hypothetical protein